MSYRPLLLGFLQWDRERQTGGTPLPYPMPPCPDRYGERQGWPPMERAMPVPPTPPQPDLAQLERELGRLKLRKLRLLEEIRKQRSGKVT